jgi:hypothetical protein
MLAIDNPLWILILGGTLVMTIVVLRSIGQSAAIVAWDIVEDRRTREAERQADNEAAEAAGKAASLEPLALNADGTIEEPILAVVEAA